MKIVIFGGGGKMGRALVNEAFGRAHQVTAVVRDLAQFANAPNGVSVVVGDATDPASIARIASGHDLAINAVGPSGGPAGDASVLLAAARALPEGLKNAHAGRLLIVGGASSLEVAPGVMLLDTPGFPAAWKGVATAHRDAFEMYKHADIDWTYFSPAAYFEPGQRTGEFRTGTDRLLTDEHGQSKLSYEDLAVAMIDEAEQHAHPRQRVAVAY